MSIEKQLTDVSALLIELLAQHKAGSQQNVEANAAVVEKPPVKKVAPKTPTPPVKKEAKPTLGLTAKAAGYTLESFYAKDWTDEMLIAEGYATMTVVEAMSAKSLDSILSAKAGEMGDEGAAIFDMLKVDYGITALASADPAFFDEIAEKVNAL